MPAPAAAVAPADAADTAAPADAAGPLARSTPAHRLDWLLAAPVAPSVRDVALTEGAAESRRLRDLEADPWRFMTLSRPISAALWRASMLSVAELARRAGDPARPAIVALAEAAVLRAAEGSLAHVQWVADRLEGRPGLRPSDGEPESLDERAAIAEAIEAIVIALTEAKLRTPDDNTHDASRPIE